MPDHRGRPRRRGETLEAALLAACREELAAVGYVAMTVQAVARRARASKVSIYARWPTKAALVMAATYDLLPDPAQPADTGSLRGDLIALFRRRADLLQGPAGEAMRGMLSEALAAGQPAELAALSRGSSVRAVAAIVLRARRRGEPLGGSTLQLGAASAVLRYHYLIHGGPIPDLLIEQLVDEVALPLLADPAG